MINYIDYTTKSKILLSGNTLVDINCLKPNK